MKKLFALISLLILGFNGAVQAQDEKAGRDYMYFYTVFGEAKERIINIKFCANPGDKFEIGLPLIKDTIEVASNGITERTYVVEDADRFDMVLKALDTASHVTGLVMDGSSYADILLEYCPALRNISISNTSIKRLYFTAFPLLQSVKCINNPLLKDYLAFYDCFALQTVECSKNPLLEEFWFSECPALQIVECSENTALKRMDCSNGRLESLLIDNCPALKRLSCRYNRLTSLILSDMELQMLLCNSNSLPLSNLADLVKLVSSLEIVVDSQYIPILCQVGRAVDLRSEMNIYGEATQWNVLDTAGNIITDNANWGVYHNGNFSFKSPGEYRITLYNYGLLNRNGDLFGAIVNYNVAVVDSVARPVFSEPSGAVKRHTPVSLSTSTPDARIYYTTDGSAPDSTALLYTDPIYIDEAVTIKAIAMLDTLTSRVATVSYTIAPPDTTIDNEHRVLAVQVRIYAKDKVIYVPETIGEVRVFTANGQCVYKGSATTIPVKRSGLYVVVAKGGRWKVAVR